MVSDVEAKLAQVKQTVEWGKQAQAHHTVSMAYTSEALIRVAEAALAEHASHFEQYKDDEEGCATCFWLNDLAT